MQRTEASRNGSELRSKAGQGVATAWHRKATRRHGTEKPSDGMARKDNATAQRSGAVLAMSSNGKEWL